MIISVYLSVEIKGERAKYTSNKGKQKNKRFFSLFVVICYPAWLLCLGLCCLKLFSVWNAFWLKYICTWQIFRKVFEPSLFSYYYFFLFRRKKSLILAFILFYIRKKRVDVKTLSCWLVVVFREISFFMHRFTFVLQDYHRKCKQSFYIFKKILQTERELRVVFAVVALLLTFFVFIA